MPLDLTDPSAAADQIAAARGQANADAAAATAPAAADVRAAFELWRAALSSRLADPLDDARRDAEKAAWQALGDARQALATAVGTAKAQRTLALKAALGG